MKKEEEKNNKHEEAILKKNIFFEFSSTNSNEDGDNIDGDVLTFEIEQPADMNEDEFYENVCDYAKMLHPSARGKLEITEEEVLEFLREIHILCDYLELNEEDILNNPSNIGYNPTFGLRIIDYGLAR